MTDPVISGIILVILILSVALHEFGHAKSADAAGDPTPRSQGRVTLNPLAHLDPMGTLFMFVMATTGFGIGWGRPVMVDPRKMHNPRWDHFMSVLWGPMTNVILAVIFAALFRFAAPHESGPVFGMDLISGFFFLGAYINIALCLFNMIPIGPLDGHWILGLLLPEKVGARFMIWSRTKGMFVLIGILVLDQLVLRQMNYPSILGTLIRDPAMNIALQITGARFG